MSYIRKSIQLGVEVRGRGRPCSLTVEGRDHLAEKQIHQRQCAAGADSPDQSQDVEEPPQAIRIVKYPHVTLQAPISAGLFGLTSFFRD